MAEHQAPSRFRWIDLFGIAGLALLYAVTAKFVLGYFAANGVVSLIWPPSGLALAALVLGGKRYWPGVFLGALAGNLLAGASLLAALCIGIGNTLEAVVGCWLLLRYGDFDPAMLRSRDFIRLVIASAASALVASTIGNGTLLALGQISHDLFALNFMHWWQGDVLGMMLVASLILVWRHQSQVESFNIERIIESVLCLVLSVGAGQIILVGWQREFFGPVAYGYWMFLFVSWAAVRCGRRVVVLVLGIGAAQAIVGAMQGTGFFASDLARTGLENLWFYVALLSGVGFSLVSLVTEGELATQELRREKQLADDIVNSLPGLFYMLDDQGRMVRWNPAMVARTGYSDEELAGKLTLEMIAESSRPMIAERIQQVFVTGEATAEAGMLTKLGEIVPYHFTGRRTDIDGRACLVGLGEDISERLEIEQTMREVNARYRLLFETTDIRIVIIDPDGRFLEMNESNARFLGGMPDEFIGRSIFDFIPSAEVEHYRNRYRLVVEARSGGMYEDRYLAPDGPHWFSSQLEPARNAAGEIYGIQIVSLDITQSKLTEEALRRSEELWKFALEGAGDSVWDWDVVQGSVSQSLRWKEMLGYAPDDDPGLWSELVHPDDVTIAETNRQALLEGEAGMTTIELRMRCKDGSWKWILSRGMVVSRDSSGKPLRVVGTNTDITPLKEHQRQLEHIAHYDALTNLPNRLLLAFRLQQAMAQSQRRNQSLAVAYLDLDGFKAVNDRFGHNIGDELLILVAQRMKTALREGDTLARIGGDEFIAVIADLDQPQDCDPVLQRLLQAASAPVMVDETMLSVSASVGVTLYPGDGADADQLLRHADQAMYQAKQAGKNRYHMFDVDRDAKVQRQHESIENIRGALQRREFVLHYQPKVNMRTGALVGAEALIRWQHPQQGLLSPAVFLPVIEEHALNVHIGEWVIETALRQMAEWQVCGFDIPVSVNIGAYHLQHGDFVPRLEALLAACPEVDPGCLELEILETSAFDDLQNVSEVMRASRRLGVTFALDDFGTGYASLTYLKRLPAELLKIDQSFVRDMLDDPDDLAIVEGVVGLAQAFQRRAIAEGVETVAHGEMLLQLGCELAQGYGIARPMPAAALTDWAGSWQPDASWQRWREHPLERDDLGIAFAEVRHRHWLRGIEHALDGQRESAPAHDAADCPLTLWQEAHGRTRYGMLAGYGEVVALHRRLHDLGQALVDRQRQGAARDGETRLNALRALHEELAARLRELVQAGRSV